MKNFLHKELVKTIIVLLLICIFGVFYWQTIMSLPLFGDATIHGANATTLLEKGWGSLNADYPALYYYLMANLYTFFGDKGYNLVPYTGFLFLLLSTFLFVRQITKSYYTGLLAIILVGASPKLIYYVARMYQEILLSALFIFCIYLMFKYLETKKRNALLLFSFFIGLTLSIKQQGLFILYPSIIFFFFIIFLRKGVSFFDFATITTVPLLICFSFYGVLFHTVGLIQPGSDEFGGLKLVNTVGQKIFTYNENDNTALYDMNLNNHDIVGIDNYSDPLEVELENIGTKYSQTAFIRGESRHILPTEVITNFQKFNQANSLYIDVQGIQLERPTLLFISFFSILGGFIYCIYKYKIYSNLLIFTLIFLPINYALFIRNSDQQRYQLFIPIFVVIYLCIFLKFLLNRIHINRYLAVFSIIFFIIFLFIPILSSRVLANENWAGSQIYSPSIGGIASIEEAGNWFKENTNQKTLIGQECGDELHYYSDRNVSGDWRIYFLKTTDLKTYFAHTNISYYVIYKSQLVNDKDWVSTCWVPMSFYKRMQLNFPEIYTTKAKDIIIYKV